MSFSSEIRGPLRVCPGNSRFFTNDTGRAVFLTGSHTWATLHDRRMEKTPVFDYEGWLNFLSDHGHNFFRLWAWEHTAGMQFTPRPIVYEPSRYLRTGPGLARDGQPKFDLMRLDDMFFRRLRERVAAAAGRGIYVAVMLFQGFSLDKRNPKNPREGRNAFDTHPMHPANNIHGIDGDTDRTGRGYGVHSLDVPEITRLQEKFVMKAIEAVGDLDNVLWEISNESPEGSVEWQYHFIRFIQLYEDQTGKRHPVGMSGSPIKNPALDASAADWISPYRKLWDPEAGDGSKVVIVDSDHIDPEGFDGAWPWRCLTRGLNFTAMDPYRDARVGSPASPVAEWEPLRRQMGLARRMAERVDLVSMTPRGELASTGFCLASAGREYLVYVPRETPEVELSLGDAAGRRFDAEWLDCETGETRAGDAVAGGASCSLAVAGFGGDAVLRLVRRV